MTSQGVKFKAQKTKLRISLVIIGQSTLNLPSLLHPNKFLVFMLRHKILKSKFNRPAKLSISLGVR